MSKNILIIVGADKGGVGKTTVSRTLIDYFAACRLPIRAFDTESPKGNLQRFHPNETEVVDITSVFDQMRILDTIRSANKSTLIDVRAGYLSLTLQFLQNIGFLEALKRAEVRLVLLHVLSSMPASGSAVIGRKVRHKPLPSLRVVATRQYQRPAGWLHGDTLSRGRTRIRSVSICRRSSSAAVTSRSSSATFFRKRDWILNVSSSK